MTRAIVNAGNWDEMLPPVPPPVQYVITVAGGRVHFTALHGDRHDRRQTTAHGVALTPQEAMALGRALTLAGMEAK